AHVPAARPGAADREAPGEARLLDVEPEDALGERAAADVAQADEEDADPGCVHAARKPQSAAAVSPLRGDRPGAGDPRGSARARAAVVRRRVARTCAASGERPRRPVYSEERPKGAPCGSRQWAMAPPPGIGIGGTSIDPPSASTCWTVASRSRTSR